MSSRFDRYFTCWCYFVAASYIFMKWLFAYWWSFDSAWFWSVAFRVFPDWGEDAAYFGALLPAKVIGTRNFSFGVIIFVSLVYSWRWLRHKLLGFLLLQAMLVEFFDGFWLAYGKFNAGWERPNTDFYMNGGFAWFPFPLTAGMYMLSKERLDEGDSSP